MSNLGLYIAVDGPDGVGKSTFVDSTDETLCEFKLPIIRFSEPDRESPLWPAIRDHRLSGEYPDTVWAFILAGASLALQRRKGGIIDLCETGALVITDRSPLSFVAHYWSSIDKVLLKALLAEFRKPDILIVLYADDLSLLETRLCTRGQAQVEIDQDMSTATNYFHAACWLKELGWNVVIIKVDGEKTARELWSKMMPQITELL